MSARNRLVVKPINEKYLVCDGPKHKDEYPLDRGIPFTLQGGYGSLTMDCFPEQGYETHYCSVECLRDGVLQIVEAEKEAAKNLK